MNLELVNQYLEEQKQRSEQDTRQQFNAFLELSPAKQLVLRQLRERERLERGKYLSETNPEKQIEIAASFAKVISALKDFYSASNLSTASKFSTPRIASETKPLHIQEIPSICVN